MRVSTSCFSLCCNFKTHLTHLTDIAQSIWRHITHKHSCVLYFVIFIMLYYKMPQRNYCKIRNWSLIFAWLEISISLIFLLLLICILTTVIVSTFLSAWMENVKAILIFFWEISVFMFSCWITLQYCNFENLVKFREFLAGRGIVVPMK